MSVTSKTSNSSSAVSLSSCGDMTMAEALVGSYECTRYIGKPGENPWHHVTIEHRSTIDGKEYFRWKNSAGVQWALAYNPNHMTYDPKQKFGDALAVGTECPYHKRGHTSCKVVRDSNGKIKALLGPWGERYDKVEAKPPGTIETKAPATIETKSDVSDKTPTAASKKAERVESEPEPSKPDHQPKETRDSLKEAVLREKAETLRLKNKEMRQKQQKEDADDFVEEARKMKAFTSHLASVAQNIQALAALKDTLHKDKACQVDRMTLQLFEDMKSLVDKHTANKATVEAGEPAVEKEEGDVVVVGQQVEGTESDVSDEVEGTESDVSDDDEFVAVF